LSSGSAIQWGARSSIRRIGRRNLITHQVVLIRRREAKKTKSLLSHRSGTSGQLATKNEGGGMVSWNTTIRGEEIMGGDVETIATPKKERDKTTTYYERVLQWQYAGESAAKGR